MMLMIIIALYLPPIVSSTYCSFVLLSLSAVFDTRDNGSTGHRTLDDRFEWSIMTTCHLSPVNYHLCHPCPPVTSPLPTLTSEALWYVYDLPNLLLLFLFSSHTFSLQYTVNDYEFLLLIAPIWCVVVNFI